MPKYKSSCCKDKVYAVGSGYRIDADNAQNYQVRPGATLYHECDRCKRPCTAVEIPEQK